MAEFVRHHPLQFIACQRAHAATGDPDDGVPGSMPGGEGIDAVLPFQQIHIRHRHAGGDGHFLHDI